MATKTSAPDAVVLVPGFLGFSRFGGFYYFADRVVAALRGFLEARFGYAVPVVPCATLPTNSLADRQTFLLQRLHEVCTVQLADVERLHLVGHSTGGVDVQLLTQVQALGGKEWLNEYAVVRDYLTSVVTISAPHHGTGLAESPVAQFGADPLAHPEAVLPVIRAAGELVRLLPQEAVGVSGIELAHPKDIIKFVSHIVEHRELIGDLRPAHMETVHAGSTIDPRFSITCFVTGTMPPSPQHSDGLFADLYGATRDGSSKVGASNIVQRCIEILNRTLAEAPSSFLIAGDPARVPAAIDIGFNDGIVNTARQLVVDDSAQLGAIVVADHADVLGHYDRKDELIDKTMLNAGLFHSGAGFGDEQFFELYRRVGDAIERGKTHRQSGAGTSRRGPAQSA